jgi:hypothetical protein
MTHTKADIVLDAKKDEVRNKDPDRSPEGWFPCETEARMDRFAHREDRKESTDQNASSERGRSQQDGQRKNPGAPESRPCARHRHLEFPE